MTREEAIKILDEVIPPPEHHTVDLDHLRIAQAWLCIKETLTAKKVDKSTKKVDISTENTNRPTDSDS